MAIKFRIELQLSVMAAALLTSTAICAAGSPKSCDAVSDAIDKAICANASAKSADDEMSKAYNDLRHTFDSVSNKALLDGQREWLQARSKECAGKADSIGECIKKTSKERVDKLRALGNAVPKDGPGLSGTLVPYEVNYEGNEGEWSRGANLFRFRKPSNDSENAFNRIIDKAVADLPVKMDGAGGGESGTWSVDGTLVYASPNFISIRVDADEYAQGAAHGLAWTQNINFDLKLGKRLVVKDWFSEGAKKTINRACSKQLHKQVQERKDDDGSADQTEDDKASDKLYLAEIDKSAASMNSDASHWTFDSHTVHIIYDQDSIAGHSAGAFECKLPVRFVKGLSTIPIPID